MALPGWTPTTLYKAEFSGTVTGEIFSFQNWFTSQSSSSVAAHISSTLATHITNMLATAVSGISGTATLAAAFRSDVLWTRMSVVEWDPVTNAGVGTPILTALTDHGTGAAFTGLPDQIAMAVTLRRVTVGRRGRNRFYLPPFQGNVQDRGIVNAGVVNAVSAWVHNQQAAFIALADPFSWATFSGAAGNVAFPVDTYIGNVLDTIRRRRNHLVEARLTTPF